MKKSATLETPPKPARAGRLDAAFNLHGYDIGMVRNGPRLKAAELKALTGTHGIEAAAAEPVATVLLVDDMDAYEVGGALHDPDLLLGEGFALNYASRTIYYPRAAPRTMHMKNLGDQNPFVRTVVFCIGLLAEYNGLESVARKASQFQTPLYLHASSVLTPKGALVFCGECTFGKTTISTRLLKDYPLLEDDQVTILVSAPGVKKPAAPRVVAFGDSRRKPSELSIAHAPLAGIFWLKKDPENAFEKIDQAEAAALMLNPMVNAEYGTAIQNRLRLFKALFETVPCRRLAFKKESAPLVEFLTQEGYI